MSGRETLDQRVIQVRGLSKHFRSTRGWFRKGQPIKAVQDVSLELRRGETLGIVGESGSGKSTLIRMMLRLTAPTSGDVEVNGADILSLSSAELRKARRDIQVVFQDPYASLDPRMKIGELISEPWRVHRDVVKRADRKSRVSELLRQVGLNAGDADRFATELSGGQRQRVAIARALALRPRVLILDEPLSALDVSVQAQIVELLRSIQRDSRVAYVIVSHDLSIMRLICDRIAVMYLGKVVEVGDAMSVCERPTHPYTQALLSAVPRVLSENGSKVPRLLLKGETPDPANPPPGCLFSTRCWAVQDVCKTAPPMRTTDVPTNRYLCHFDRETLMQARIDHQARTGQTAGLGPAGHDSNVRIHGPQPS